MKRFLLTGFLTLNAYAAAKQADPCPQIDFSKKDPDGMAQCPAIDNAYQVFRCPLEAANSFHQPTDKEKVSMRGLLTAFAKSKVDGVKAETTKVMLDNADALNLQVCRDNNVLLFYTKPGVKNYSGPFMMLREGKSSRVLLIGPHDDSDGTFADTKIAVKASQALGLVSNGHQRGNIPDAQAPKHGDFVHETDNLGTFAVATLGDLFKGYVWLHVHGMKNPDHVLYRSRSTVFGKVYEAAIVANTNIKPDAFAPLNADFTVDSRVNTNWYLKTEMPARIHQNNQHALANVVKAIELEKWAWDDVAPAEDDVDNSITYAPQPKPVKGPRSLACIGIKYQDTDRHTDQGECKALAKGVGDFYERLSRNALSFKTDGFQQNVALNGNAKNLAAAEKIAMDKHPGFDMYDIVGMFLGASHAGGKVAHLIGNLLRDHEHEVGHLLGLGHAGAYKQDGSFDPYGDGLSVMSAFSSSYLTAPQIYSRGWLQEKEAALFEAGKVYELKQITDVKTDALALVVIKGKDFRHKDASIPGDDSEVGKQPNQVRDAYVSFPQNCDACLVLHMGIANGAGTQRVKMFGSEYYDDRVTGLHIKVLDKSIKGKMKITLDFAPKPAAFIPEDEPKLDTP